jgi:hypothetical protein
MLIEPVFSKVLQASAGVQAAQDVAMMFGVSGGKEVGGCSVLGSLLPAAPALEQAVAAAAEHPDDPH